MPEYKSLPQFIKSVEGRTVTGLFAIHGNVDNGLDRSHPGAFAKTFTEQKSRAKFLWNHNFFDPPVAAIKSLREVGRDELPPEVLEMAPDATGGAEVTREYLDTPRGEEILSGIKAGAITEMSYGYDAVKIDFTTEGEGDNARRIRELKEVRLYDVSDVLWGMNPATVGSKNLLPLDLLAQQLSALLDECKAGRRNSAKDAETMKRMHDLLNELEPGVCPMAEKAEQPSRAEHASLTRYLLELQELELATM